MDGLNYSQYACNFLFLAGVLWFCSLINAVWKDKKEQSLREL